MTLAADEDTLIRLATLLCYANLRLPEQGPRPAVDLLSDTPAFLPPDPEALREEAVRLLRRYVDHKGRAPAQSLLERLGATRLSELTEHTLPLFIQSLELGLKET